MDPRAFWETVYRRFDPERPVAPAQRAPREHSPVRSLLRKLGRPYGADSKTMVYGTVGAGKTSELRYLAEQRADAATVIFADLLQHFVERVGDERALQHLQPWEVVLLVGVYVHRAGLADQAIPIERTNAFQDAVDALVPRHEGGADVRKLATSLAGWIGADGTLVDLGEQATRWTLRIGLRDRHRVGDQDDRAAALIRAVNAMIGDLVRARQRPVTLIIDGLDRIEERVTVEAMFVDSTLLHGLECGVVLTVPVQLRAWLLVNQVRGFDVFSLENVPVLDHRRPDDPSAPGPGIATCRQVWDLRTRDLVGVDFPPELLDRLARASGGRLRDYAKLMRLVVDRAYDARAATVEPGHVEDAIVEARRLHAKGLRTSHVALLKELMASPPYRLPDDPKVDDLLRAHWVLRYPNDDEWWYPHALLLEHALRA